MLKKEANGLKYSHGRYVVVALYRTFHKGFMYTGHRSVISFIQHQSIFIHFVHYDTEFYYIYTNTQHRTRYIDDDGSVVRPKKTIKSMVKILNEYMEETNSIHIVPGYL